MDDSKITLNNTGKRFNFDWIFRDIQYTFSPGQSHAVTGPNGIGKSTLLQLIAGCVSASAGTIEIKINGRIPEPDELFRHISFTGPYFDLPEELTCLEMISFQKIFKPYLHSYTANDILEISGLKPNADKVIRYFSSGLKQRLKISLAVLADVPIVLLDEPTTNLDENSAMWYLELIHQFGVGRLFIIASNQPRDYSFCTSSLNLADYRPNRL